MGVMWCSILPQTRSDYTRASPVTGNGAAERRKIGAPIKNKTMTDLERHPRAKLKVRFIIRYLLKVATSIS